MKHSNKTGVVLLAAGKGLRLGGAVPKQHLLLAGEPMYMASLRVFTGIPELEEIVLVTDREHLDAVRTAVLEWSKQQIERSDGHSVLFRVAEGGAERPDSVVLGLQQLSGDVCYVLVHDAARPFVTEDVVRRVIDGMLSYGAAIPCVSPKDTIRMQDRTLDRAQLYQVQTPQGFRRDILEDAYRQAVQNGFAGTDDASYVEQLGIQLHLVEGDPANRKITTPDDMPADRNGACMKIGTGFDVHRFADTAGAKQTQTIRLGGVDVPYHRMLLAHSDGDVLLHAVMDALLGAAGLGDIGERFPDSDPAYKDADSLELLRTVGTMLAEKSYSVGNIDATLIGQEPKIAPYKKAMEEAIAGALGCPAEVVNVKGTTTEKLGFTGRKEGLAAEAVCLLVK